MISKTSPYVQALALFSILFGLGFYFLVLPQVKESASVLRGYNNLVTNQSEILASAAKQKKNQVNLDYVASDKAEADLLLPSGDNQYDLTIQIQGLTQKLGIPLSSFNFGTLTGGNTGLPGAKSLQFTLSTTSNYNQVQQFVHQLVSLNRFIQINQLSLVTLGTASAPSDEVTVQLTGQAFYL